MLNGKISSVRSEGLFQGVSHYALVPILIGLLNLKKIYQKNFLKAEA